MEWTYITQKKKRQAKRILVGTPEGQTQLERTTHKLVDNIKVELKEMVWERAEWINLAQNRDQWLAVMNTVMNLRVP